MIHFSALKCQVQLIGHTNIHDFEFRYELMCSCKRLKPKASVNNTCMLRGACFTWMTGYVPDHRSLDFDQIHLSVPWSIHPEWELIICCINVRTKYQAL